MPPAQPPSILYDMTQMEISRDTISLTINGEPREMAVGTTALLLLEQLDLHPRTVVVELNRQIIRDRDDLAAATLRDGDVLELVHFVGGG